MSSFQPSSRLRQTAPSTTTTVISTTSSFHNSIESHPTIGKWWIRNYGLGPTQQVKYLTRRSSPLNRHGKVQFRTASAKMPIVDLNFGPGGGTNTTGALVVASGPRVSMYGGIKAGGTSALNRALKAGSAAQSRREEREDMEEEVDLFGGKFKNTANKEGVTEEKNLDKIDADRNISTGGLLSQCAVHRSDGRLIAIGTEGGTVKICDANSRATLRTFGSSKSSGGGDRKAIRTVAWLRDGKRVVAGGDDGVVRVWNVSGGLKDGGLSGSGSGDFNGADVSLVGHGDSVRAVAVVSFRKEDHRVKSSSGGGKGKKRVQSGKDASVEDSFASSWSQLVVSGSYDHTIRVWDIGSNEDGTDAIHGDDKCLSVMNHGDPVQALLVLPPIDSSGYQSKKGGASKYDNIPLLVSAGGTVLKIWNPLTGSCLGTFQTKHAKTITSMCLLDLPHEEADDDFDAPEKGSTQSMAFNRRKRHILTGGLDGLLRVHSASNDDIASGSLPFLHGTQLSEPISALALSQDMSRLAVGTTTGIVIVHQRRRLATEQETDYRKRRAEPKHGTFAYFMRGAHEKSHDPDDYLLMHQKKQKLAEYDVLLRKFRYGDALDKVLQSRQPQVVIAVIEELGKRRGLTIALSNRDEESLEAILSFTIRFIDNPQYTPYLIGVAHILCDIYGSLMGQSAVVDELFTKLREKVANECSTQRMLLRLLGQIDYVMTTAEIQTMEEQR